MGVFGLMAVWETRGNDVDFDDHGDTSCRLVSSVARIGQSSVALSPPSQL